MARSGVRRTAGGRSALLVLVLLFGSGRVFADGLISVPTAEIPEPHALSIDLEYDGGPRLDDRTALSLFALDARVTSRLAVGMDLRLSQGDRLTATPRAHMTYLLRPITRGFGLAAGFGNVGVRSFGEQAFVVASGRARRTGLHVGWTQDSGHPRAMFGLEQPLGRDVTAVTDWITGSGNFAAFGLALPLGPDNSLTLAYLRANERSQGDGLFVGLSIEARLRKGSTKHEARSAKQGTGHGG
jgi:hypothetical protein